MGDGELCDMEPWLVLKIDIRHRGPLPSIEGPVKGFVDVQMGGVPQGGGVGP